MRAEKTQLMKLLAQVEINVLTPLAIMQDQVGTCAINVEML